MSGRTLLVTGASGHLGQEAVRRLLLPASFDRIVAASRDPGKLGELARLGAETRRADFDDPAGLVDAFRGVDRVLLVSPDAVDPPGRRGDQAVAAIRAAAEAGVDHVVYTSFVNPVPGSALPVADDHRRSEAALAASGLGYTALRNGVYADGLLSAAPAAVASGRLVSARGDGAVAWVTRSDCARAAAAALADAFQGARTLSVTGPEALTDAELARILAELSGRPVEAVSVPVDELVAEWVAGGLPEGLARFFAAYDVAAARGELAEVTDMVRALTGVPATSVRSFLEAHRAILD